MDGLCKIYLPYYLNMVYRHPKQYGTKKLEWKVQIRYKDSEAELCGGGAEKKRVERRKKTMENESVKQSGESWEIRAKTRAIWYYAD